jgi:hypothetical protein
MATQPQNHFRNIMNSINDFLDQYILPWPVRYLTFRFVILATIALLLPLIVFANNTIMVLLVNSYLNTMSVAVSSIVLLYATITEVRQKQIAELQEKRAQEDHIHVTEMHSLVLQSLQNQNEEIQELKQLIASLSGNDYVPAEQKPPVDLYAMHPRGSERFQEDDHRKRFQKNLHHNSMVTTVRGTLVSAKQKTPGGN